MTTDVSVNAAAGRREWAASRGGLAESDMLRDVPLNLNKKDSRDRDTEMDLML